MNVGVKYLDIPVLALSFLPNVVHAVVVQCINTDLVKVEYHMCTVKKSFEMNLVYEQTTTPL